MSYRYLAPPFLTEVAETEVSETTLMMISRHNDRESLKRYLHRNEQKATEHAFKLHDILLNAYSGAYLIPLFGIYRYRKKSTPTRRKEYCGLWFCMNCSGCYCQPFSCFVT